MYDNTRGASPCFRIRGQLAVCNPDIERYMFAGLWGLSARSLAVRASASAAAAVCRVVHAEMLRRSLSGRADGSNINSSRRDDERCFIYPPKRWTHSLNAIEVSLVYACACSSAWKRIYTEIYRLLLAVHIYYYSTIYISPLRTVNDFFLSSQSRCTLSPLPSPI